MRASALLLLSLVLQNNVEAFHVVARSSLTPCARRVTQQPQLAAASTDVSVEEAAAAVKAAAKKFGKAQFDAATSWLDAVVSSGEGCPTEDLLAEQLVLFDECMLDDEGDKCKELDAALSAFEASLAEKVPAGSTKTKETLQKSKNNRAAARVRAAASKFGAEQKKFAESWTKEAVAAGSASGSLMEKTLDLFDQCQVTEDGKADPKCVKLFEALDNLQVALVGEVVTPSESTVGFSSAGGATRRVKGGAAPAGGPSVGQFAKDDAPRNNGCWPYN